MSTSAMSTTTPPAPRTPARRTWTTPRTACLESRAEISGYAGTEPWPIR